MDGSWKVAGCIPRGFSRYYVVRLLGEGPRTGKEIIEHAASESGGAWRPSPGLVYPLLGRLLSEGIVSEEDGRYDLTEKGRRTISDVDRLGESLRRQAEVVARLGEAGRFAAMGMLERVGAVLGEESRRMSGDEEDRYRRFLESELQRLGRRVDIS
ncbi:MAG: PadR family transcriptional regulator [Nitrosopumilus sp.]|nr:PadR family transcriptional regulator [Nitrosopumilus sp.]MDA7943489.1 PadR family transcriptional regulator [Nitrosopumilus sp.]MDA7944918.1 PadR family transcriptional regulator [Nitrosopumilus sp.]MDA7953358.1 PadR family transcriptional regulator [Nitrosopumilus sp.]MDA7954708.1 PadR family transcriptional regulator [Nitrosopumilus sp.]